MAETTIKQRQIEDGAINNAKVAAGAAIASSKLADGANFIKKDGSVAMIGALNMGSQLINSVATPSVSTDAATKGYVDTQIGNLNSLFDSKGSCRAATTGNIDLSNPGTDTFDGVTLSATERLLVRAQSTASQNGIYAFDTSSTALTRVSDMDAWAEVPGALVIIEEGTTYADSIWLCTNNAGGTLGSTSIAFTQLTISGGLTNSNFADKESPSGSINGSNTAFTLTNSPVAGSEHVYLNGLLQLSGGGNDYTISGANITMTTAPLTGETLKVSYRY